MSEKSDMPTISVYVPARLNSQRLPRKALRDFGGEPLVAAILSTLKQSRRVTDFALNTESEEIAAVAEAMGVHVYRRSPALARPETTTEEILADFARNCPADYVAAINPTNPLLSAATIDRFFDAMIAERHDTAFSVSEYRKHVLMEGAPVNYSPFGPHPRTQDVRPVAMLNWAIVAWRTELVRRAVRGRGDSIYLGRTGFLPIPELEAVDIDTEYDFEMALALRTFERSRSDAVPNRRAA
ncbi:MAG: acylneuraminate cytidylyltransferase family protein [Sphingomonadales bacterium]|nr:acylneuraminate cytidylyltransferase family protein [Sphingomonadales bacterium]